MSKQNSADIPTLVYTVGNKPDNEDSQIAITLQLRNHIPITE